jgi:Cys-rich repeat protein
MIPRLYVGLSVGVSLFLTACNCGLPANRGSCSDNDDCEARLDGNRICLIDRLECVQCVTDSDCGTGNCSPDGACVQCASNAQCGQGQVCGSQGRCVDACGLGAPPCPSGQVCQSGTGACVECLIDSHCGVGHVCGTANTCKVGCSAAHPSCPTGSVCNTSTGTCVGCNSSADCGDPTRPVCDVPSHTCVACLANADCKDASKPLCDTASKTCVACLSDAQCHAGELCKAGACVPGCSATHSCPTGKQCQLSTGTCVECVDDTGCSGLKPRCDTGSQTCVECVPGPTDNCPAGKYCRADFVCEQGCKNGSACANGVCLSNHNCGTCVADSQCAAGYVCQSGACVAGCSAQNPCGTGNSCCGQHCVNYKTDVKNCGSCGNVCGAGQGCCNGACVGLATTSNCGACGVSCGTGAGCCAGSCKSLTSQTNCGGCGISCSSGDFCDGVQCRTPTYPNFCLNKKVYVIYDQIALDDAAANTMASTIPAQCPPGTQITYAPQTNPTYVDQTTGEPLVGAGSTMVLAGGPFPNKPVKWLERTGQVTRLYFDNDGVNFYFKKRADGSVVSQMPGSTCSSHYDRFLLELVTDPRNGTLSLIGYGMCSGGYGTAASGWFYANTLLPNRASYPKSWYVVSWTDNNNDSAPNSADTFTVLASGT